MSVVRDQGAAAVASGPTLQPEQLLQSLDRSAITKHHLGLYAATMAGHFFDGFDITVIGVVLPSLIASMHLSQAAAGALASSAFVGMLVGAIVIGTLADHIGRKNVFMLAVGAYAFFSLLAALAPSYGALVVIRALEGLGLGAEVVIVFAYLAEFLPQRDRAKWLSSSVFFWQISPVFAALLAGWLVPTFGWRIMFLIGVAPAIVVVIMWRYLPESVRFLLQRGDAGRAERIVRSISTVDPSTLPRDAAPAATASRPQRHSARAILQGRLLRPTLGLWIIQLFNGFVYFGILSWLPSIFIRMGFGFVHSLQYTASIAVAGAVGNVVAGFLLETIGRRLTLALYFVLGGVFLLAWGTATDPAGVLTFGTIASFFAFGASGPIFTYGSELYPTRYRGTGTGWSGGWIRFGGLIAPTILGVMLGAHVTTYTIFVVLGALEFGAGAAALLLLYETHCKTLEQMAAEMQAT